MGRGAGDDAGGGYRLRAKWVAGQSGRPLCADHGRAALTVAAVQMIPTIEPSLGRLVIDVTLHLSMEAQCTSNRAAMAPR